MGRLINKSPLSNNTFNLEAVNFINDYKGPRGNYNISTKDVTDENGIVVSQELYIEDSFSSLVDKYDLELPEELEKVEFYYYVELNNVLLISADIGNAVI
jgi:hypothetical protein